MSSHSSTSGPRSSRPTAAAFRVEAKSGPFPTSDAQGRGAPLAQVRKHYGADEWQVRDVLGQLHTISLKPWANADPETTYIRITGTVSYA